MLEAFGPVEVTPQDLPEVASRRGPGLVKVVFGERHMFAPNDPEAPFDLQEYFDHPERYHSRFGSYLPYLDAVVNCIYWEQRYPRLITKKWARETWSSNSPPRLKVIGDISCDTEGAIELTVKPMSPGNPCFVYEPLTGNVIDGIAGNGPVVMSVYNLPCEFALGSSESFSRALKPMVPAFAAADWTADFDALELPDHVKGAVIAHRGQLTPSYQYLSKFLS